MTSHRKLIDGLLEVAFEIDAEEDAVVDQGVGDGQALATTLGAGEKIIAASDSEIADSSFGSAIVNLERPVGETATKIDSLVFGVGRGTAQTDVYIRHPIERVDMTMTRKFLTVSWSD